MRTEPQAITRSSPRRLLAWWGAGWLLATLFCVVTWGMRRLSFGLPFYDSWSEAGNKAMVMIVGALFSPFVLFLFTRIRRTARPERVVLGYISLGMAYWLLWSAVLAVHARFHGSPWYQQAAPVDAMARMSLFMGLVVLSVYVVMAMAFETVWYRGLIARRQAEATAIETEMRRARATALQARVNPGFAIETLDRIAEILGTDVKLARRTLTNFGELLRTSLSTDDLHLIELTSEFDLARRLLQVKLAGRHPEVEVFGDAGGAGSIQVPPFFLRPVVNEIAALIPSGGPARVEIQLAVRSFAGISLLDILVVSDEGPFHDRDLPAMQARLKGAYHHRRIRVAPAVYGVRIALALEDAGVLGLPRSA